jgi:hypothetical protein
MYHNKQHYTPTKYTTRNLHRNFTKIIMRIPKGKAAGPFADISDIIRSLTTHKDTHNNKYPYTKTVYKFFKMIYQAQIPRNIKNTLHQALSLAYTKTPSDLTKLRPVAVGGGWRRAFTSTIVRDNNHLFTKHLMPYNFAIGVKGGTNFIYHTLTNEIEHYIHRPKSNIKKTPPTRCLISLDITNMFNEVSRQKAMEIIDTHFKHLSPYTKLLLQDPTQCWYLLPDGNWSFFTQNEGLPQGCLFSPVFAALVLNTIIKPIDKKLRARANERKLNGNLGDDKKGGITNLLAYVDDLNCVIPIEDSLFFAKNSKN